MMMMIMMRYLGRKGEREGDLEVEVGDMKGEFLWF